MSSFVCRWHKIQITEAAGQSSETQAPFPLLLCFTSGSCGLRWLFRSSRHLSTFQAAGKRSFGSGNLLTFCLSEVSHLANGCLGNVVFNWGFFYWGRRRFRYQKTSSSLRTPLNSNSSSSLKKIRFIYHINMVLERRVSLLKRVWKKQHCSFLETPLVKLFIWAFVLMCWPRSSTAKIKMWASCQSWRVCTMKATVTSAWRRRFYLGFSVFRYQVFFSQAVIDIFCSFNVKRCRGVTKNEALFIESYWGLFSVFWW